MASAERGVGQLPACRAFLLSAAQRTLLTMVKGRAVLPASQCVFHVTQQDLPSNCPLCSNQLHPVQTSGKLSLLPLDDFSRNCPTGLDLTVHSPVCSRGVPMKGFPEDWY